MKAVLLVNMGSPSSEAEMRIFLKRMFLDKAIIKANYVLRLTISMVISTFRYKNSWQKYQQIGGSPLIKTMNILKSDLEKSLPNSYSVHCAYSYSEPDIYSIMHQLYISGVRDFIILPLYPHECFSTTGSIDSTVNSFKNKHIDCNIKNILNYYKNEGMLSFWQTLIENHISENKYSNAYLLFSAHSIPEYQVNDGDKYTDHINENARLIAEKLNLLYTVSYQSKIGRIKWAEPTTDNALKALYNKNIEQIIIIPISFLTENLETLYDLDIDIIPKAKSIGIKQISRIVIPESHTLFINTFTDIVVNI